VRRPFFYFVADAQQPRGVEGMIQVEKLSLSYKNAQVLKELDFEVRQGEIFGIIGPNGSGKTTLLKILSGLYRSYAGQVTLCNRDLKSYSQGELARHIAVVPQETHVAFPFSALEIVIMGRSPHLGNLEFEKVEDLEIARQSMVQTATWEFASRSINTLSGGEKQRVILARALAQRCNLLILDEPTAFLDIRHQIEICRLLKHLNRQEGLTVIVVFHDLNLASICCHRLLLLNGIQDYKIGNPADVVTYANIKATYGIEVYVGLNAITGLPYYMPMEDLLTL
jgi:iron complex transport system ATP-binding protein